MSVISKIPGGRVLGPLGLSSREKNSWDNSKDKGIDNHNGASFRSLQYILVLHQKFMLQKG